MPLQRKGCSFISDEDDNSDELQGMEWVYMCSCDKQRSAVVAALGPFVNMKHEGTLTLKLLKEINLNVYSILLLTVLCIYIS